MGHNDAFHRMLYVFACQSASCVRGGAVKVLRAQLPRENSFYSSDLDKRATAPSQLPPHPCITQPRQWCSACGFRAGSGVSPSAADVTHILTPAAMKAFSKAQDSTSSAQPARAVVSQLLQWLDGATCPAIACCAECSTLLAQWLLARLLACASLVASTPVTCATLQAAAQGVLSRWGACKYAEAVYMPLSAVTPSGAVFAEHSMYTDAEPSLEERRAAVAARDAGLVSRHTALWQQQQQGTRPAAAAAAAADSAQQGDAASGAGEHEDMDISDTTQAELLAASGGRLQADLEMRAFKGRVAHAPGQVLRFCRWLGAQPLWVGSAGKPRKHVEGGSIAPACKCGAPRDFEFQVMPQILHALQVPPRQGSGGAHDELDFGTIAVYTCTQSCAGAQSATEWVYTQATETHMSQPPSN